MNLCIKVWLLLVAVTGPFKVVLTPRAYLFLSLWGMTKQFQKQFNRMSAFQLGMVGWLKCAKSYPHTLLHPIPNEDVMLMLHLNLYHMATPRLVSSLSYDMYQSNTRFGTGRHLGADFPTPIAVHVAKLVDMVKVDVEQ